MNDLCMSLGDCGASVNYIGDLGESYSVKGTPKLGKKYLDGLKGYSSPKDGQFAEVGNLSAFYGELGIPGTLGDAEKPTDPSSGATTFALATGGLIGVPIIYLAQSQGGLGFLQSIGLVGGTSPTSSPLVVRGLFEGSLASTEPAAAGAPVPGLEGFGGALAGAAIGLAVTAILIKITGIGAGLPPAITYGLLAAGALAGGIIGFNVTIGGAAKACAGGPAGCIIGAIILVVILVLKLLGIGDTKKKIVQFSCNPWQAPRGGFDCDKCGQDGFPCSKYSCENLGQTCEFINEGTSDEQCVNIAPDDVTAPTIRPSQNGLSDGFRYTEVGSGGFKVEGTGGEECIKAHNPLSFGIELDEPAQCRYDTVHTGSFDEMAFSFGGRTLYLEEHRQIFTVPNLESLGLPGFDPSRRADYSLFVRCMDKSGRVHDGEYVINFCIRPGDDGTAPQILSHSPEFESLKHDASEQNVIVYTNEPADCKWDTDDKVYESMANDMACANDIQDQGIRGFACEGNLPIGDGENKFYVRCKDQPWLREASGEKGAAIIIDEGTDENGNVETREVAVDPGRRRNVNTQSYIIKYSRSVSNLMIDSISHDGDIIKAGVEPVSVEVIAKTSGGVDGTAKCSYSVGGSSQIDFFETLGSTHRQVFQSFSAGEKLLPVYCVDSAGNIAERTARFSIEIDVAPPKITRVFDKSGTLVVVTEENAECGVVVGGESCGFNLGDPEVNLMSGLGREHSYSFNSKDAHYIKCRDSFGNIGGGCGIIVRRGV
jgi:hypothetical protein